MTAGGDPSSSLSSMMTSKAEEISLVLSEPDVDLWKLRELALSEGGLVNDTLRKRAWPKLVGIDAMGICGSSSGSAAPSSSRLPPQSSPPELDVIGGGPSNVTAGVLSSLDAEQIDRDVARCTWHLLTGSQRSRRRQMANKHRRKIATLLKKKQKRLGRLINLTLVRSYDEQNSEKSGNGIGKFNDDDKLRYYQGYHDISSVFLSALSGGGGSRSSGLDLPSRVLLRVSRSHFRDAMRSDFRHLSAALRIVLFPLLGAFDPEVHARLIECDMEPFFALSWIITWFAHDVRDTTLAKRLFGAFIVGHPLLPVYVSVAMVLHPVNRSEVLGAECDFAEVHNVLANLPRNSCRVGWKATCGGMDGCGGGYVSGEEGEDDETIDDEDLDASYDQSFVSDGDFAIESARGDAIYGDENDDESSALPSLASSSSILNLGILGTRVPFQELIDMSISFMRRIPPRNLQALARRYYADKTVAPLLAESSSIALLQPPPSWGLASTTPSDWVLRQRAREERGLPIQRKRTRTRGRRRSPEDRAYESESGAGRLPESSAAKGESNESRSAERKVGGGNNSSARKSDPSIDAIIASGIGPDGEEEDRQKRRRKRILVTSLAVALVSVTFALVQSGAISILIAKEPNRSVGGESSETSDVNEAGDFEPSRTSLVKATTRVAEEICDSYSPLGGQSDWKDGATTSASFESQVTSHQLLVQNDKPHGDTVRAVSVNKADLGATESLAQEKGVVNAAKEQKGAAPSKVGPGKWLVTALRSSLPWSTM